MPAGVKDSCDTMETIANLKQEVRHVPSGFTTFHLSVESYVKCSDPGFLSAHRQHASLEVCQLMMANC